MKYPVTGLIALFLCCAVLLFSCDQQKKPAKKRKKTEAGTSNEFIIDPAQDSVVYTPGELHQRLIDSGLVNIHELDTTIVVSLKYATDKNFLGARMYEELEDAFLVREVAEKLVFAQYVLKCDYPFYNLIVYDATRPRKIQQKMWDFLKLPPLAKSKFISNPEYGSLHNFGAAVDVGIINENGYELDMGTPYDFIGELAYPRLEEQLREKGLLTARQIENRQILRDAMVTAGFLPITTEWWHFNSCTREEARVRFKLIE
jgi:D-alanyl-D-alanine dipeptidase